MADSLSKSHTKSLSKYIHLVGSKAVILFPALGTPCLVEPGGGMRVIIAAHYDPDRAIAHDDAKGLSKDLNKGPERDASVDRRGSANLYDRNILTGGSAEVFSKISASAARLIHSHLCLLPWNNNNNHITSERYLAGRDREAYVARAKWYAQEASAYKNMIYPGQEHMNAVRAYEKECYQGWYLGDLAKAEGDFMVEVVLDIGKSQKFPTRPFGVLHKAAVKMYVAKHYRHLFQLEFRKIRHFFDEDGSINESGNTPSELHELLWMYYDYDLLEKLGTEQGNYFYKPGDELLSEVFEKEINQFDTRPETLAAAQEEYIKIIVPGEQPVELQNAALRETHKGPLLNSDKVIPRGQGQSEYNIKVYELPSLGARAAGDNKQISKEEAAGTLPFMASSADAVYLTARHPVYFYKKKSDNQDEKQDENRLLNIGVVADPHISLRQSLYRMSNAQVIPGLPADQQDDSPLIGPMAHESLRSFRNLLDRMRDDSSVDMVFLAGDLYDHTRNLDPRACLDGDNNIQTAGDLWRYTDYRTLKGSLNLYPHYLDGLLGLRAVYEFYGGKNPKPLFYVSGNHEGYENPYPISPRVVDDYVKANAALPADHNLTIYEAALLYGPHYGQIMEAAGRDQGSLSSLNKFMENNLKKNNMDWLYLLFTPWRDCLVDYGNRQSFLFLSWGNEEKYLGSTLAGAGSLPRSKEAFTEHQLTLVKRLTEKRELTGNKDLVRILCSHFTIVNNDYPIPLFPRFEKDVAKMKSEESTAAHDARNKEVDCRVGESERNVGGFLDRQDKVYGDYLKAGNLEYALCGHSHRAGFYVVDYVDISTVPFRDGPVMKYNHEFYVSNPALGGSYLPPGLAPDNMDHITKVTFPPNKLIALASGACGTVNQQNNYGEFAYKGLDSPQGMILYPQAGEARIVRDESRLPRLAVLMDYLWESGKKLFDKIDVKSAAGKLFSAYIDQEFIKIFGAWPVRTIQLHAVTLDGKHIGRITMHVPGAAKGPVKGVKDRGSAFKVDLTADQSLQEFAKLFNVQQETKFTVSQFIKSCLFFFSVRFSGPAEKPGPARTEASGSEQSAAKLSESAKFAAYYDINSPYCFPAVIGEYSRTAFDMEKYASLSFPLGEDAVGAYFIVRPGDIQGGEVPDFAKLEAVLGYMSKNKRQ